jgi:hypothetical protein
MKRSAAVVALSLSLCASFVVVSAPARAADAVRGSTLYHVTYACIDCHGATPGSVGFPTGTSANDVVNSIRLVPTMHTRYGSTLAANPADLNDIGAYLAISNGVATGGPDLDQHGLTGSWYEPATSGQGIEVEFFPNLVAPGTAFVAGAWFTFDVAPTGGSDHDRWYTFAGNAVSGQASVPVAIYQNVGGNFDAPPVTHSLQVGSGTLAFADCTHGTFSYTFTDGSGRNGAIALTRLLANVTCAASGTPPVNADFGFSGNWYTAATSGQGFLFEVNPAQPFFFLTWYTYAPAGQAAGAAGQRWFTAQGPFTPGMRSVDLTLAETTGGAFDRATNPAPSTVAVGIAKVTFASCSSAQVQYAFNAGSNAGKSGTIALTRVGPVPAGCAP